MIVYIFFQVIALHVAESQGDLYTSSSFNHSFQLKYPNLYFTKDDLPKLRAQAASSHSAIYQQLVKHVRRIRALKKLIPPENESQFNAHWNAVYGNILAPLALYCVLNPADQDALDLAKLFMERLTNYNKWSVKGKENDDVPLAHSLLGYAICFDCLHDSFTQDQRVRFATKMLGAGTELFMDSHTQWWGWSYIHNHVATNNIALLTAAIVLKPYHPEESLAWQKKSLKSLDATMKLLQLVVDGSFQEGVAYGTYTMKSLTQFMLISERHLGRTYRTNNWLREHFNFLLYTVIPGFKFTVGFADTNQNWSHGPESQLSFLESYIHKDGRAEWLRSEIKRRKTISVDNKGVLHMDFLFHNNSLKAKRLSEAEKLHVFSDWGVITYGGGIPKPHVFLAFKCSHLHGRAINLLRPNLHLKPQSGFKPGHEHPDQGSFVFVTKNQAVITEPRYGPKYTFLQNTLMFGLSDLGCSFPSLGQMGECKMWFDFLENRTWFGRGELVGYSRENDVIFMSGEMTQVYDVRLGLTNVYRALIMLAPTVLVVVDTVEFRADSSTTYISGFFHNSDFAFNTSDYNFESRCATIGLYKVCWNHLNAETVKVDAKNNFKIANMRYSTNFIKVTWERVKPLTCTAFVFHGTQQTLQDLKLSELKNGVKISLKLDLLTYNIILSTRHDDPRLRRELLGTSGFGKVYINSIKSESVIHLGVKATPHAKLFNATSQIPIKKEQIAYVYPTGFVLIIVCAMVLLLFNLKIRRTFSKWVMAFISLSIWLAVLYSCLSRSFMYSTSESTILPRNFIAPIFPSWKHKAPLNAVLITGLQSSGMELARELFTTNPDFITIGESSELNVSDEENLDLCEWKEFNVDEKLKTVWDTLLNSPMKLRENSTQEYISLVNPLDLNSAPGALIQKSKGAFAAVSLKNPGWLFRSSLLLEKNQTPLLYVVRDPRSWIEQLLSRPNDRDLLLKTFRIAIEKQHCNFPPEIKYLREAHFGTLTPHVALAQIWSAFATYALRLMSTLPPGSLKIARFEDIIKLPKATADDVYSFLEMPFPAAVEHRIMQVTLTRLYKFKDYGTIEPKLCEWGKILKKSQVKHIESICGEAMKKFGYG